MVKDRKPRLVMKPEHGSADLEVDASRVAQWALSACESLPFELHEVALDSDNGVVSVTVQRTDGRCCDRRFTCRRVGIRPIEVQRIAYRSGF